MTKRHLIEFFSYLLLLCLLLHLFVRCVKDESIGTEKAEELICNNANHGSDGIFTLPVNLNRYNHNPKTKSSQSDTAYYISVDSLIDMTQGRSLIYDNGWMYYQVPFKSNRIGRLAAIAPGAGSYADSLVPIKCFYLQVENYKEPKRMEYSVTMIPTYSYHKYNPDYDFFDKPSFSGYVLYSLKDGTFVRGEVYRNGMVMDISLIARSDAAVHTKSADDDWWNGYEGHHFTLDNVVVTALSSSNDNIWQEIPNIFTPELLPRIDFSGNDGEGGGGSGGSTRNKETYYTVTYKSDGCHVEEKAFKLIVGAKHQYQYKENYNDSCSFIKASLVSGESNHLINGNQISISSVVQNLEFKAFYGEPSKECKEIKALMESIPEFKNLISKIFDLVKSNNSIEWSLYAGVDPKNVNTYSGRLNSISYRKQPFKIALKVHSHPSGNPMISAGDFALLLAMIEKNEYFSAEKFAYSVMAGNHLIIIKISDLNRVMQIIINYPNKDLRSRLYEQFKTEPDGSMHKNVLLLSRFLNSCGFDLYFADFYELPMEEVENTITLDFKWIDTKENDRKILDCYNLN